MLLAANRRFRAGIFLRVSSISFGTDASAAEGATLRHQMLKKISGTVTT